MEDIRTVDIHPISNLEADLARLKEFKLFFQDIKGDKGTPGDKGEKGEKGDRGLQGFKGDKGDKGTPGDKGEKGDRGRQGFKGDRGLRGFKGDLGRPGKDGKDGKDGIVRTEDVLKLKDQLVGTHVTDIEIDNTDRDPVLVIKYNNKKDKKLTIKSSVPQGGVLRVGGSTTIVNQGEGQTDLQVIDESEGGNSSGSYTSSKLTLITFADTDKYTNNTKTLNYTGDELTQTVNVFDYEDQTWTVTRDYTYLAGVWQTKSINITKV